MINHRDLKFKILTAKEYKAKKLFYYDAFYRLASEILEDFDFDIFFEHHPINSVTLLMDRNNIISYMIGSPEATYDQDKGEYINENLSNWRIDFIETAKPYKRQGYGRRVLSFGVKDMISKGAVHFDGSFNEESKRFIDRMVQESLISIETLDSDIQEREERFGKKVG